MANVSSLWQDDYWILVIQLFMRKPAGLKKMYSRQMVELSMELHLPPSFIYGKMFEIRNAATPYLLMLKNRYKDNPRRLSRDAMKVRGMMGFANSNEFYDSVDIEETFEKDFKPIPHCEPLTPVALILVLDLYFRLTPITMVAATPEVQELARLIGVKADVVADVLNVYQIFDPYLNRDEFMVTPLLKPCQQIWQRYGNGSIEELAALAAQLRDFYA